VTKAPPYTITPTILRCIEAINRLLGLLEAAHIPLVEIQLRKENKIRTIHSSLAIEGNTLSLEQVSCILEGKRVLGPKRDIKEVENAIEVYRDLSKWDPLDERSLLQAHKQLMQGLIPRNGQWRNHAVGIYQGDNVTHVAPPARQVSQLMDLLFTYINTNESSWLIKACVFHYELEFIHPFTDGNGRMGRLWQQLLLMQMDPIFEYIPVEEIIKNHQGEYYATLRACDEAANSIQFIEFSLEKILMALELLPKTTQTHLTAKERLFIASQKLRGKEFKRKDYVNLLKISAATASRDLLFGVQAKQLTKKGDKALTRYRFVSH
jgi:Fic family protein